MRIMGSQIAVIPARILTCYSNIESGVKQRSRKRVITLFPSSSKQPRQNSTCNGKYDAVKRLLKTYDDTNNI